MSMWLFVLDMAAQFIVIGSNLLWELLFLGSFILQCSPWNLVNLQTFCPHATLSFSNPESLFFHLVTHCAVKTQHESKGWMFSCVSLTRVFYCKSTARTILASVHHPLSPTIFKSKYFYFSYKSLLTMNINMKCCQGCPTLSVGNSQKD